MSEMYGRFASSTYPNSVLSTSQTEASKLTRNIHPDLNDRLESAMDVNQHDSDTGEIDPTQGRTLGNGTPYDADRAEIAPTALPEMAGRGPRPAQPRREAQTPPCFALDPVKTILPSTTLTMISPMT